MTDRPFNQKRVRMQVRTDADQTVDMKALLLSLNSKLPILRKESKAWKVAAQRWVEALEPEKPINAYDLKDWTRLSIQGAQCIYSHKGAKFRFTLDANTPDFMRFLKDLVFRHVPFKVYDILNEDEVHRT